jgi:xylulose-5-phosphate/fructose-6-phosphate phosphoketolase
MVVRNDLDRYHLTLDAIDRLPEQPKNVAYIKQDLRDKLIEHRQYVTKYGDDLPAVKEWRWPEA